MASQLLAFYGINYVYSSKELDCWVQACASEVLHLWIFIGVSIGSFSLSKQVPL